MRSKGGRARAQPLADAVRRRRKELGVTQIELARLAGCGPVFIYDLESAKTTLRLDKLLDVLDVLGLEIVVQPGHARLRTDLG
jgi:HTH-type transcriptional regulator/antitoxin HipB